MVILIPSVRWRRLALLCLVAGILSGPACSTGSPGIETEADAPLLGDLPDGSSAARLDSPADEFAIQPADLFFDSTERSFAGPPERRQRRLTSAEVEPMLNAALRGEEKLIEVRVIELPASGRSYAQGVAQDRDGARVAAFGFDGAPVDPRALERGEVQAHFERYGKMSAELYERMEADDVVPVQILLHLPIESPEVPSVEDPHDVTAFLAWVADVRADHARIVTEHSRPLVEWLASEGIEPRVGPVLPLLRATLPTALLRRAALHDSPLVERIDLDDDRVGQLHGHAAWRSMGDEQMAGGECVGACTGHQLFDVGLWELTFTPSEIANENDRIDIPDADVHYQVPARSCTSAADCQNGWDDAEAGYECFQGKCVVEHTSWVLAMTGMFGSYTKNGTTFTTAGAPDHRAVYVANETPDEALEWMLAVPLLFVNRSQSLFDYTGVELASRHDFLTVTTAAGNGGQSEALACDGSNVSRDHYNDVCVGSYAYNSVTQFFDDRRSPFSSYLDRPSGAERPHLLGPGSATTAGAGLHMPKIVSTGNQMSTLSRASAPITGTSFAAPAVLSLAMQAQIYEGAFRMPHTITKKAVLMAAAMDANGDGDLLDQPGDATWAGSADGKDGAGRPDTEAIERLLDADDYLYIQLTNSKMTSCGAGCREHTVGTQVVPSGAHLRVAMVYSSCVNTPNGVPTLRNDLDLLLERPVECFSSLLSATTNSEVEMVHSACVRGGLHTIKIRLKGDALQTCNGSSIEPVAVAWSF